jgi:hypothetical protein
MVRPPEMVKAKAGPDALKDGHKVSEIIVDVNAGE